MLIFALFIAMAVAFPAQAENLVLNHNESHASTVDVTLTFSEVEKKVAPKRPSSASMAKSLPRDCKKKKICRIPVNGFSDSEYVYGEVELYQGERIKGFIYRPGKQVYVYGKVVQGNTFQFLLQDAEGNLYRLSPVENGKYRGTNH